MNLVSQRANELRKAGNFKEALAEYKKIAEKDKYVICGMLYCYRKLDQAENAVILLNKYLKENKIDMKNETWLKTEFVWSYVQYFLNEKFHNKEMAIKAANVVVSLEDNNEIILKKIKNNLCTNELIQRYPGELKELLDKIDDSKNSYISAKMKIKFHLRTESSINTCIYYILILKKIRILLELKQYEEILKIHADICNDIKDRHIDRGKAKALQGLGRYEEAIEMLETINIKFGKEYYIYTDIGDIYMLMEDKDKALKFYYQALNLCHEDKFMLTTLSKVSQLLLNNDEELARKHVDLEIAIRKQQGWKIKNEELEILESLNNYPENSDYKSLRRELKSLWRDKANEGKEIYQGVIEKILDNGNGFIKIDNGENVFFKRNKKNKFVEGDKVVFYIEKSFDRKKEIYSKAATQIRYKK